MEFNKKVNKFSDGREVYNIHFIIRGNTKYEYEIDALTGNILERDQEPWEADDDMEYKDLLSTTSVKASASAPAGAIIDKDAEFDD